MNECGLNIKLNDNEVVAERLSITNLIYKGGSMGQVEGKSKEVILT